MRVEPAPLGKGRAVNRGRVGCLGRALGRLAPTAELGEGRHRRERLELRTRATRDAVRARCKVGRGQHPARKPGRAESEPSRAGRVVGRGGLRPAPAAVAAEAFDDVPLERIGDDVPVAVQDNLGDFVRLGRVVVHVGVGVGVGGRRLLSEDAPLGGGSAVRARARERGRGLAVRDVENAEILGDKVKQLGAPELDRFVELVLARGEGLLKEALSAWNGAVKLTKVLFETNLAHCALAEPENM